MLRRVLLLVVLILTLTASNCIGTGGKTVVRGGSKFADDVEYLTGRLGSSADDVRRTLNETASRSGESPEALLSFADLSDGLRIWLAGWVGCDLRR
jgi:hypothetical protein